MPEASSQWGRRGLTRTTPTSWWAAFRSLAHPPRPPGRWLVAVLVGLTAAAGGIALTIALGVIYYGRPERNFAEARLGTYLSVLALFGCAAVCMLLYRRLGDAPFRRFWATTAVAFVYLGLDDWILIHENFEVFVDWLFGLDPRHPLLGHLDDFLVIAYAVFAAVYAYRYRAELIRLRWMVLTLGVAFLCFAGMVLYDLTGWSSVVEESLKIVAGTLILLAFLAAYWDPALTDARGRDRRSTRGPR